MSLNARQRAVLDATALDLIDTAPLLAGYLAQGPEALRQAGIKPRSLRKLVPGYRRARLHRWFEAGKR